MKWMVCCRWVCMLNSLLLLIDCVLGMFWCRIIVSVLWWMMIIGILWLFLSGVIVWERLLLGRMMIVLLNLICVVLVMVCMWVRVVVIGVLVLMFGFVILLCWKLIILLKFFDMILYSLDGLSIMWFSLLLGLVLMVMLCYIVKFMLRLEIVWVVVFLVRVFVRRWCSFCGVDWMSVGL